MERYGNVLAGHHRREILTPRCSSTARKRRCNSVRILVLDYVLTARSRLFASREQRNHREQETDDDESDDQSGRCRAALPYRRSRRSLRVVEAGPENTDRGPRPARADGEPRAAVSDGRAHCRFAQIDAQAGTDVDGSAKAEETHGNRLRAPGPVSIPTRRPRVEGDSRLIVDTTSRPSFLSECHAALSRILHDLVV
jgi:hypothetical protein